MAEGMRRGSRLTSIRPSSLRAGLLFYAPLIYLGVVWVTSFFTLPLSGFTGVPIYALLTPIVLTFLNKRYILYAVALTAALELYEITKTLQPEFHLAARGVAAIVVLGCILGVVQWALEGVRAYNERQLAGFLRVILWIIVGAIAVQYIVYLLGIWAGPEFPYRNYIFSTIVMTGVFAEPSHLALGISPFIIMFCLNPVEFKRTLGISSIGLLMALSVVCVSATVLAIWCLAIGVAAVSGASRLRFSHMVAGIMAFIVLAYAAMSVPQISDRVLNVFVASADVTQRGNVSALVFLKGVEMTRYALLHYPLGVGFENMAVLAPRSSISYLSNLMFYLNSEDGTSMLFKGICELGVLFEVFAVAAAGTFFTSLARNDRKLSADMVVLLFQFGLFAYFIRGTTYFDITVPIALGAYLLVFWKKLESVLIRVLKTPWVVSGGGAR